MKTKYGRTFGRFAARLVVPASASAVRRRLSILTLLLALPLGGTAQLVTRVPAALQIAQADAQRIFSGGVDYDGDGKTDVGVFRPSTGTWYIINSSTATWSSYSWGGAGDMPVPGDYDGDGKTDVGVFRPSTGTWYIINSSTATWSSYSWGGAGDIPLTTTKNEPPQPQSFTLAGVISDAATSMAVGGAAVRATDGAGTTRTDTTDGNGDYSLPALREGAVSLTVTASSFQSATRTINLTSDMRFDISLTPIPPPPSSRYRVGAICTDGWRSDATGSGACSHHGGVRCWLYSDGSCTNP